VDGILGPRIIDAGRLQEAEHLVSFSMSGRLPTQITSVKPSGEGDRVRFGGQFDSSSAWILGRPANECDGRLLAAI
jgi:hypothetical protein